MDTQSLVFIVGSGAATGVGGIAVLTLRHPSERTLDGLLGFTAGVMLAAAAFSLLVPALDRGTVAEVLLGLGLGTAFMAMLDRVVPHAHARYAERGGLPAERRDARERATLLLAALTIHNIPEGMAVGAAFAAGGPELGIPIAIAIGLQNVPEGFAAAVPLVPAGVRRSRAAGVAALTGAVEPPAALAAFAALELVEPLLTPGLGFAAGAMLYVVVDELIPESHGHGNEQVASLALLVGFAVMLALDNAFG
jgi:zinc transporter, ZIP family